MIGMIDADQRVDAGISRRLKLVPLQLALERGQDAEIVALQADRRLLQIDELDAGDRLQDFRGSFHDAGHAGMPVQRDPHLDLPAQQRGQLSQSLAQKQQERRHLERPRAALSLNGRNTSSR